MQETNKKHSKQQEHKKINSEVSVIDLHRACMEIHYEFRAVFFARVWPIQLDVLDRVFGETVAPRYAAIFDYQRVRNTSNIFLNNIKTPARQCGGSKRIMYYNVDDYVNL